MQHYTSNKYTSYRWIILSLVFLATAINYYDRIVLSVIYPEIKEKLSITEIQYSYINAVFMFAYTFGFLAAGKFIDWAGTRLGYLFSILSWSVAASMHASAGSSYSLGIWRGMLGITESANFPAAIKSVSEWFPKSQRSFATSLFNSGPHIAMVTGPPVIAFLTLSIGWRWAFLFFGFAGIALAVIWPFLYKKIETISDQPPVSQISDNPELTWREILRHRETYGIMLGKLLTDPVWWFYIIWLPSYLNTQRGFNIKEIGYSLPFIYAFAIILGAVAGWFPGYLMQRGWTVNRARKTIMFICAMCLPFTSLAVLADNVLVAIFLVALACGAHSGWSNNIFTVVSDQFPSRAVGSVTGLAGFAGGIGGILFSTVLVGYIVTYIGYVPIFLLMGILHPIAMLCIHLLIKRDSPIEV